MGELKNVCWVCKQMNPLNTFPENINGKKVLIISENNLLGEGFLITLKKLNADTVICNFKNFQNSYDLMAQENWDIIIYNPFSIYGSSDFKEINNEAIQNNIKTFFEIFIPRLNKKCSIMTLLPLDLYNAYSNRDAISSLCGFIHGYVKSVSIDLASKSIRANSAVLGYIEEDKIFSYDCSFNSNKNRSPMKRAPDIDELVFPVLFLASDAADFATGGSYAIDGGWSSTWGFDTTVDYPIN